MMDRPYGKSRVADITIRTGSLLRETANRASLLRRGPVHPKNLLTQFFRVSLAISHELDDELGDHFHQRIVAIHQFQIGQDSIKCGRHDRDLGGAKYAAFLLLFRLDESLKRLGRHDSALPHRRERDRSLSHRRLAQNPCRRWGNTMPHSEPSLPVTAPWLE